MLSAAAQKRTKAKPQMRERQSSAGTGPAEKASVKPCGAGARELADFNLKLG